MKKGIAIACPHDRNGLAFTFAEGHLKILDRILSCLLILSGIGHTIGSIRVYQGDQMTLLWALGASLFVFLFGAISLIRAARPADRTLAWVCLAAGPCWIVASLRFAALIGNFFDPRPLIFVVITLGLCWMCVRTIVMRRSSTS